MRARTGLTGLVVAGLTLVLGICVAHAAPAPTIGDGTHQVGSGSGRMPAGTYTAPGGAKCAWARLGPKGNVLAKGGGKAAQRVVVAGTDAAFRTAGCGRWAVVPPPATTTTTARRATTTSTSSTTTTTTTSTTLPPSTTTTTLPLVVRGTVCAPEGAMGINERGVILVCARSICAAPNPRAPLTWVPRCGDPMAHIEPGR